jgi:tRNA pseudouridine38-40 synthase
LPRFAVGIEYDGTAYAGWQSQSSAPSIQALTEQAFSSVANEPVALVCAGRTDAGVHAREQVAHFDTNATRPLRGWLLGASSNLPRDISVAWITPVPMHFHARYSAETRTYRYFIFNRRVRSSLVEKRATQIHKPLDHERMRAAAATFIGEHDFSAFRSSECQAKSTVRRLTKMSVERQGEWIAIEVTANAFLHHMVRNLVGVLLEIGRGEQPVGWAGKVLESRDRTQGGVTAPAAGLYMWSVDYPAAFGLPVGVGSVMIAPPFSARV